jgi:hypothetical protein
MKALLDHLARLASLAYQMRFIVSGTSNEYVLPEELLEVAENRLALALAGQGNLSEEQRDALTRLREVIGTEGRRIQFDNESVSNLDLVRHNEAWGRVRTEAAKSLGVLGFDLRAWELANVTPETRRS